MMTVSLMFPANILGIPGDGLYIVYRRERFPDWRSRAYRWLSKLFCGSSEYGHVGLLAVCDGKFIWMDTNYSEVSCHFVEAIPENSRMVYMGTHLTAAAVALHLAAREEGWRVGHIAALTSALKPGVLKHLGYIASHYVSQFPCTHLPSFVLGLWLYRENEGVIPIDPMKGMDLVECFAYLEGFVPLDFDLYQFALDQWKPVDFLAKRV